MEMGRWLFVTVSVWIVVIGVGVPLATWWHWDWLSSGESAGTTLRNAALAWIGLLALPIAYWRSWVAMRQLKTSRQSLDGEKYHRALELLSSRNVAARLAGIHRLGQMAKTEPTKYHVEVMGVLCDFVRNTNLDEPTSSASSEPNGRPTPRALQRCRDDIQAAMKLIAHRSEDQSNAEGKAGYRIDLHGADLRWLNLLKGNLARADLTGVNLEDAKLDDTDLTKVALDSSRLCGTSFLRCILRGASIQIAEALGVVLGAADLSGAMLCVSDLRQAKLNSANLSGANLNCAKLGQAEVTGTAFSLNGVVTQAISQQQVDSTAIKPGRKPPDLTGLTDQSTGEL